MLHFILQIVVYILAAVGAQLATDRFNFKSRIAALVSFMAIFFVSCSLLDLLI